MQFLSYFFIFLFGLAVGSFLNVLIPRLNSGQVHRLPQGKSIRGRSHCPKCGHQLAWQDLIPLLSFVLLGGKCRYCRERISLQYPIVELVTGILFIFIAHQFFNFSILSLINFVYLAFITSCLIVIFVSDLKYFIIPDEIILAGIIGFFIFKLFEVLDLPARLASESVAGGGFEIWRPLLFSLLSAVVASAFFFLIVLITKGKGMGLGDVKMAFLMGLILGWPQILIALLFAFVSGALVGLALILAGKAKMKSEIPFGTFLAAATFLAMIFGTAPIRCILPFLYL